MLSNEKRTLSRTILVEFPDVEDSLISQIRGDAPLKGKLIMAKTNGNGSVETVTEKSAPAKMATGEELRKLFGAYDTAQAELETLTAKIEAAKAKRSNAVAAICTAAAGKKGPFRHPKTGLVLSAVERVNRETGESNWFFKGPAQSDLIEV